MNRLLVTGQWCSPRRAPGGDREVVFKFNVKLKN